MTFILPAKVKPPHFLLPVYSLLVNVDRIDVRTAPLGEHQSDDAGPGSYI